MTVVLGPILPNGVVVPSALGDKWSILSGVTFSSTYKTGGDASFAEQVEAILKEVGRGSIDFVQVDGPITHYPKYDYVNNKLQWIVAATGVELAEAAYPAGITGRTTRAYVLGR